MSPPKHSLGSVPRVLLCAMLLLPLILLSACQRRSAKQVVIYTSVDQNFSEPILSQFQEETGIEVLPVYDVEAAKTTGLVNRLIAEKEAPQADVFWNGEFAQTLMLKDRGVLAAYQSEGADAVPKAYRDPEGYWTGFAGRARIILVNTDALAPDEYPSSIMDLTDSRWPAERVGIAYPIFGTTSTQAAALYAYWGPEKARAFYEQVADAGVRVVDGNSVVRDQVVEGQLWFGLTDTDDACTAVDAGERVHIILPDQDDIGTLIVPNTVGLVAGGPNPEAGKQFIEYLLSPEVDQALIASGWSHISLRDNVFSGCQGETEVRGMDVGLQEAYQYTGQVRDDLRQIFVR